MNSRVDDAYDRSGQYDRGARQHSVNRRGPTNFQRRIVKYAARISWASRPHHAKFVSIFLPFLIGPPMRFRTTIAFALFWFLSCQSPVRADAPSLPEACDEALAEKMHPEVEPACTSALDQPSLSQELRINALTRLGLWSARVGNNDDATRNFDAALELSPEDARLLQFRAVMYLRAGDIRNAFKLASLSAEIDPSRGRTFEILGDISRRAGQQDRAAAYYGKAIDANPALNWSRYQRATLLIQMRRAHDAIADTQALIGKSPEEFGDLVVTIGWRDASLRDASLVLHAQALEQAGFAKEAEAHFDRIVRENPTALLYALRGEFLLCLPFGNGKPHRNHDALKSAEQAVALDKDHPIALRIHALTLDSVGRREEALVAIDEALRHETLLEPIALLTWRRASLLRKISRMDEAIAQAQSAFSIAANTGSQLSYVVMEDLEQRGYLQRPEDENVPGAAGAALSDAIAACMHDPACGHQ